MRQWFRGHLEAHYEGVPSAHPGPARDMRGRPHQIRIYRAHVRRLELLDNAPGPTDFGSRAQAPASTFGSLAEAPASTPDAAARENVLFQARIEHARLEDQKRAGICLEGPIFELSLEHPQLTHPARYAGRLFGRVVGQATGYFELPEQAKALPEPPLVAPAEGASAESSPRLESDAKPEEEVPQARESSVRIVALEPAPAVPPPSSPAEALATLHTPPETVPSPYTKAPPSNLPLFALVAALALTLLVTAGTGQAVLWLSFLLPSLLIRRFLRGVLPDATAFRAIGAVLIGAQVCCVSWILLGWSAAPCKEMHVLPLIALVAGVFFASVLPYLMPIAINAFGFALVLGMWSVGPGQPCSTGQIEQAADKSPASVKHPGEPRTNDDGSWPKRP